MDSIELSQLPNSSPSPGPKLHKNDWLYDDEDGPKNAGSGGSNVPPALLAILPIRPSHANEKFDTGELLLLRLPLSGR